ncbi:MAG: hand repeat-containing protein [Pedosphaera sp.]|nr:hand repeat-containing protein [Pedosphaera sp.]
MKTKLIIALLSLSALVLIARAQDNGGPSDGQRPPHHMGGPGMDGHRPPPSPVIGVLDANHDGVIDAAELANASNALKQLDKNGDGQLTPDEFCPPRPDGQNGGPEGQPPQ